MPPATLAQKANANDAQFGSDINMAGRYLNQANDELEQAAEHGKQPQPLTATHPQKARPRPPQTGWLFVLPFRFIAGRDQLRHATAGRIFAFLSTAPELLYARIPVLFHRAMRDMWYCR